MCCSTRVWVRCPRPPAGSGGDTAAGNMASNSAPAGFQACGRAAAGCTSFDPLDAPCRPGPRRNPGERTSGRNFSTVVSLWFPRAKKSIAVPEIGLREVPPDNRSGRSTRAPSSRLAVNPRPTSGVEDGGELGSRPVAGDRRPASGSSGSGERVATGPCRNRGRRSVPPGAKGGRRMGEQRWPSKRSGRSQGQHACRIMVGEWCHIPPPIEEETPVRHLTRSIVTHFIAARAVLTHTCRRASIQVATSSATRIQPPATADSEAEAGSRRQGQGVSCRENGNPGPAGTNPHKERRERPSTGLIPRRRPHAQWDRKGMWGGRRPSERHGTPDQDQFTTQDGEARGRMAAWCGGFPPAFQVQHR